MTRTEKINKWMGSEQHMSDQIMEEIMEALDARDPEALKAMFSKEALTKAEELDEQIADMMKFYKGKMVSYKGDASSETSTEYGEEVEKEFVGHYTLVTDEVAYRVLYRHRPIDQESPDSIGLSSLELVTEEFYKECVEAVDSYDWQSGSNGPGVYMKE